MIQITNNDEAIKGRYELERALLSGSELQLFVGNAMITTLTRNNFELSVEWGKLIFAWWSEHLSQSWRVIAYEIDKAELRLQVTRSLAGEVTLLTLRDPAKLRGLHGLESIKPTERRKLYLQLLAQLLTANFNGLHLERATTGADRARSVPGRYPRLFLKTAKERILAIGVSRAESQADIDNVITVGLIWLAAFNQSREEQQRARRLWFCLPREHSQTAVERLTLIDLTHLEAQIECFEVDECQEKMKVILPVSQSELLNAHPRELKWPTGSRTTLRWRDRIIRLAPDLIEVRQRPSRDGVSFAVNGLDFAQVAASGESPLTFGVVGAGTENQNSNHVALTESNFNELEQLVREIIRYRSNDSPDRCHKFYRLRGEAWLESLLRRNIHTLDADLDEKFVYSQIPTWRADERSVIDLLAINRDRRLVVIEIKAAEDPQLPLQGLDYWLRVEQARLRDEFSRRGLFAGLEIANQSPLLYLVAPRLRFHRTFTTVAKCLSPHIEAYQIGINTNWREGVRVHSKERLNGREQV